MMRSEDFQLSRDLLDMASALDVRRAALPSEWPGMSAHYATIYNRLQVAARELRLAALDLDPALDAGRVAYAVDDGGDPCAG